MRAWLGVGALVLSNTSQHAGATQRHALHEEIGLRTTTAMQAERIECRLAARHLVVN